MARRAQKSRSRRRGRKNRPRKRQVDVGFPPVLASVLVSIGLLSLVYLWLCGRCTALGKELTRMEKDKAVVHGRLLNEQYKWSNLTSPRSMEHILKRHHLVMTLPKEPRIVRVRASALARTGEEPGPRGPQYARAGVFMND